MAEQPAVKPVPDMTKHPYRVGPDPSTPPGYVLQPAIMAALGAAFANTPDLFRLGMDRDTELTPEMKRRMKRRALYGSLIGGGLGTVVGARARSNYADSKAASYLGEFLKELGRNAVTETGAAAAGAAGHINDYIGAPSATISRASDWARRHRQSNIDLMHASGSPFLAGLYDTGAQTAALFPALASGAKTMGLASKAVGSIFGKLPVAAQRGLGTTWRWGMRGNAVRQAAPLVTEVPKNTLQHYRQLEGLSTSDRLAASGSFAAGQAAEHAIPAALSWWMGGSAGGATTPTGWRKVPRAGKFKAWLSRMRNPGSLPGPADPALRGVRHTYEQVGGEAASALQKHVDSSRLSNWLRQGGKDLAPYAILPAYGVGDVISTTAPAIANLSVAEAYARKYGLDPDVVRYADPDERGWLSSTRWAAPDEKGNVADEPRIIDHLVRALMNRHEAAQASGGQ